MGLFNRDHADVNAARAALDEASATNGHTDAITGFIQRVLSVGLDGRGFFKGSQALADEALASRDGDVERAIDAIAAGHTRTAAAGGAVTSLGGFVTMPVAVPANVFEFYVLATRSVGAIASLRGYDISDPTIRTAVLLTLTGTDTGDILRKAGVVTGNATAAELASRGLPKAATMVINKAVGFRLLRGVTEKTLVRFGRMVPVVGALVGGAMDASMLGKITKQARLEFPARPAGEHHDWGVR